MDKSQVIEKDDLRRVHKAIFSNATGLILRKWKAFGRQFDVDDVDIEEMDRKLDKSTNTSEIILDCLQTWKTINGKNATLGKIVSNLETLKWQSCIDALEKEFCQPASSLKPTDVPALNEGSKTQKAEETSASNAEAPVNTQRAVTPAVPTKVKLRPGYHLKCKNVEDTPLKVLHKVETFVFTKLIMEGESTLMDTIILETRSILDLDRNTVEVLYVAGKTQKDRCSTLFREVEVHSSDEDDSVIKFIEVLMNIPEHKSQSAAIRKLIVKEFGDDVEIFETK